MKKKFILLVTILFALNSCAAFKPSEVDARKTPVKGSDRARQNLEEGKGITLGGLVKGRRGGGSYEFSTSNPMWRSSLEVLDFLPLTTVDYSGGIIITDWYNDSYNKNDSIKITVRFLSNEIQSNSLQIVVHQKNCRENAACVVKKIDSQIEEKLKKSIISNAAAIEKADKKLKKK